MSTRIAITGMGLVSPLGLDVPAYWRGLLEGRSGVSFITQFPTEKLRSDVAAMVTGFDASRWLDKKEQAIYGRVEQLSVAAAAEAVAEARLDDVDKTRIGVLLSTGQGAVEIFEEQIARSNERTSSSQKKNGSQMSCALWQWGGNLRWVNSGSARAVRRP